MKTTEENALKNGAETQSKKLSDEELSCVVGGGNTLTKEDVRERIYKALSERWNVIEMTGSLLIVDDLGADSLDVVDILQEFEKNFGVRLPDPSLCTIKTVDDFCNLVIGCLKL